MNSERFEDLPPEVESVAQLLEMARAYWRFYEHIGEAGGALDLPSHPVPDSEVDLAAAAYGNLSEWIERADSATPSVFAAIVECAPAEDEEWPSFVAVSLLDFWIQSDDRLRKALILAIGEGNFQLLRAQVGLDL